MMEFGVTTVEAKSGYGLDDFETELKQLKVIKELNDNHPLDVWLHFGSHAVLRYKIIVIVVEIIIMK